MTKSQNWKHGESGNKTRSRLYVIWSNMKQRCNNPNNYTFRWYGGRGIIMCEEWDDYLNFKEWALSHGYSDDLTIDRIDPDGDYEPSNCQWISKHDNCTKRHVAKSLY